MQSLMNSTSVNESSQDNALIELLNKQHDEYRYVLLNPLKIVSDSNPLHVSTLRNMLGERAVLPVLRGDLAHSPQHCPQLVLLASPQESCEFSWLAGSLGYARNESLHEKRYLCAWLSSAVPPEELAVILADQCNHLSTNMFIPMFEPLRFELLQAFSPPNALAASIWPVSHWWYVSTTGEIACQSGKAYEEKWRLNWGVEDVQQEILNIWQLLFSWQQMRTELPDDAAMQAAKAWLNTARTGLTCRQDRNFLALNHLMLPIDIEQHPAVRSLLQQAVASSEQSFTELLQTLPDSVWQEMSNQTTR